MIPIATPTQLAEAATNADAAAASAELSDTRAGQASTSATAAASSASAAAASASSAAASATAAAASASSLSALSDTVEELDTRVTTLEEGGGSGLTVQYENTGSTISGWNDVAGSFSIVGGAIHQSSGGVAGIYYDHRLALACVVVDVEMRIVSRVDTGIAAASVGVVVGDSGGLYGTPVGSLSWDTTAWVMELARANVVVVTTASVPNRSLGDWTTVRLVKSGAQLSMTVDGLYSVTAQLAVPEADASYFGFRSYNAVAEWRNLTVRTF